MSRLPMNPFPGLRPFTQDEDFLFFGREEQTVELLERLSGHRFVAVVGTSGSGKSSLVRCGLLSELLGGGMLNAGCSWEVAVTRPGGNPLGLLTEAILDADLYDRTQENARENLLATLSRSHFGLVEAVKQAGLDDGTNFLLVVDQFEEIFRFQEAGQSQQETANEFVSLLMQAAVQKDVPIYIVLTMRSDFIGECGEFEGLAEMVSRGEFLIPRLTRDQYKRVIEGPIKVAGGQIAPRLLQRLLNDLGQQADQLPCLQHALMRTWNIWSETGEEGALDLEDYQRVGRMSEALSLHADEIYHALASDRQRELCAGVFKALTVQESDNRGTRRPQRLSWLCQILDVSADELQPILDAYRQPGVTFLIPGPEVEWTDRTIIDISHESLMRVWTRLRHWVEEEAQSAGIYRRISESAVLHGQGKAGLYRDPELGVALAWQKAQRPNAAWAERYQPGFATAMAFLELSQQASVIEEQAHEEARQRELLQVQELASARQDRLEHQLRSARHLRRVIGGLAVVTVLAILACIAAIVSNRKAQELTVVAKQSADIAERERNSALDAQRATEQALVQVEGSLAQTERAEQSARAAEKLGREFRYATDMQLAAMLVGEGRGTTRQVLERLADYDPAQNKTSENAEDVRGFEWYVLKRLAEGGSSHTIPFDTSVIDSVLTPGDELITLNHEGQLQRWNIKTGRESGKSLDLRQDGIPGPAAISPDGRRVALAFGSEIHILDAETGDAAVPRIFANSRSGLVFSPDGRMLIAADTGIGWWDAATGELIARQHHRLIPRGPVAVSADGLTALVVHLDDRGPLCSIFKLHPQTQQIELKRAQVGGSGGKRAFALSPDGETTALTLLLDGTIDFYANSTGRILSSHNMAHASAISAIAFHPNGTALITGSMDGAIKHWSDAKDLNASKITQLKGHFEAIDRIAFTSSGEQVISVGANESLRLWDLRAGPSSTHRTVSTVGRQARFSADGTLMAVAGETTIRDGLTGEPVFVWPKRSDTLQSDSVAFSPDNRLLAAGVGGSADVSHIELWDLHRGEQLAVLPAATAISHISDIKKFGLISGLAFSPDGRFLVAGLGSPLRLSSVNEGSRPLLVYDVAKRKLLRLLEGHHNTCLSVTFLPDGTRMASASFDGTARIWDTSTWKTLHVLRNPDPSSNQGGRRVQDVAFSPNGRWLAMASAENNVILWDAVTGEKLRTLKGHLNEVWAVAFSPDSRTLASGGRDGSIRLWSTSTWRDLVHLESGSDCQSLAFSPEGDRLLAAGKGALLWSVRLDDVKRLAWAEQLAPLLEDPQEFAARVRMLSENPAFRAALETFAQQQPDNRLLQAARASSRAQEHAAQGRWREAVREVDRLQELSHLAPQAWLRTPGLIRLARALLEQGRLADAAEVLASGTARRIVDGASVDWEIVVSIQEGNFRIHQVNPGFLGARAGLVVGDVILKVDGVDVAGDVAQHVEKLRIREVGERTALTVQRSGHDQPLELRFLHDAPFADPALLESEAELLAAIDRKLMETPGDPGLLEVRAELAGHRPVYEDQLKDYTAALEAHRQKTPVPTADLQRLHRRRGSVYVALRQWQSAVDDFAHGISESTTDEQSLAHQASAQANVLLASLTEREDWQTRTPEEKKLAEMKSPDPWTKLAAALWLAGKSDEIDALVKQRPKSAGAIGDLLVQGDKKDWPRAVRLYSLGLQADPANIDLLSKRAAAHEGLQDWEAAERDWSQAAAASPDGLKLLAGFAQRLAIEGQSSLARAQFKKTKSGYEDALRSDPDNNAVAQQLADLMLDRLNPAQWTIVQPTEMTSAKGATLTRQRDGSILASGTNTDGDVYKISAVTDLDSFAAVRLEVMPDDSLPGKGPGRHESGNFHLRAFRLYQSADRSEDALEPVPISDSRSSYIWPATNTDIAGTIDESLDKLWHVWGRLGEPHEAAYLLREPLHGKNRPIVIELRTLHNLGRFRLSVCKEPMTYERDKLGVNERKLPDAWTNLAVAYALDSQLEPAVKYFRRALQQADDHDARRDILELAFKTSEFLPALSSEFASDPYARLILARKVAERGRHHLAANRVPEAIVELRKSRELLLRLLADQQWNVMTPTEWSSTGGESFEVEDDGSLFVSGPTPTRAVYTLKFRPDQPTATAFLLETLPDSRLPFRGAGRATVNGNFHVAEWSATIGSRAANSPATPIPLSWTMADYPHVTANVPGAMIDGSLQTWWDTYPNMKTGHLAIVGLKEPISLVDRELTITLDSGNTPYPQHGLGRFRLSVTGEADISARAPVRIYLKPQEIANLDIALAKAHALVGDEASLEQIPTDDPLVAQAVGDLHAARARELALLGEQKLAEAARTKARTQFDPSQTKVPEDDSLAESLSDLLLDESIPWTLLQPTALKSEGGATLTVQPDGSIAASGIKSDLDVYLLEVPEKGSISAIQLETLPDPGLPSDESDRETRRGNFLLTDFQVEVNGTPVAWSRAEVHVSHVEEAGGGAPSPIDLAVDSNDSTGWSVGPPTVVPHRAVFVPREAITSGESKTMTIRLKFGSPKTPKSALRRFRLSARLTSDGVVDLSRLLVARKVADPWGKLAATYLVLGDESGLDKLLAARPAARIGIAELHAAEEDWEQAIAEYSQLISDKTTDSSLLAKRAAAYAASRQWELARADWMRAVSKQPQLIREVYDRFRKAERWNEATEFAVLLIEQDPVDTLLWVSAAPVAAVAQDDAAYRNFCRHVVARYRQSPQAVGASSRAIKACLLRPSAIDLAELPADVLKRSLEDGTLEEQLQPWGWASLALWALRNGDAESAVKYAKQSEELNSMVKDRRELVLSIRAMAEHRLEHPEEARKALDEAAKSLAPLKKDPDPTAHHDRLIAEIVYREAEALLNQ